MFNMLRDFKISQEEDSVVWRGGGQGIFGVRCAYNLLAAPNSIDFPVRCIWVDKVPTKTAFFAWEATWGKILTLDRLQRRGYLDIMKSEGLEISQPALDPNSTDIHHRITIRKRMKKVHRRVWDLRGSVKCSNISEGPPCTGFVEGMAPVFSRSAWRCTWHLIQNDLVHGWGMDMKLGYCAQGDRSKKVGVIDSEFIVHQGIQTLGGGSPSAKKVSKDTFLDETVKRQGAPAVDTRSEIRRQSTWELHVFRDRWDKAVKEDRKWGTKRILMDLVHQNLCRISSGGIQIGHKSKFVPRSLSYGEVFLCAFLARHVLGDNGIMIGKKVTEFCVAVDPILLIKVFHCPPYYMDIPECGGPRLDTMELGMSMDPAVRGKTSTNYGGGAFYTTNPGSVPPASNSRLSPLPPEPAGFNYDGGATIDIPLDTAGSNFQDLKKKERELQAKEAELRKREQEVKRKEDAAARAGIVLEEKNWPPFFPIIHHDIANEIPIHLQKLQYVAFTTFLGMSLNKIVTLIFLYFFY
uniref:Secretory carrier-associated membrane protein n=1 Tax=Vitis vinifera TaxID=29760 RepID=A5BBH9_VITVI|nr:hypothetical protein VITISV_018472 [Vitis vinifera]